jgi:hypothetical protein
VEQKLTNTQIEYLRECKYICSFLYLIIFFLDYTTNTFPSGEEVKAIAKHWNIDDFYFHFNLGVSLFILMIRYVSIYIHVFRNGFLVDE